MSERSFEEVCAEVVAGEKKNNGIGTLGEKTLHAVIKEYLSPDAEEQEVKIGRYFADIACGKSITEIQTRSFSKLKDKLAAFIAEGYEVTVVHPIAQVKWLCWVDEETGEVTKKRKSPKNGSIYDSYRELISIKDVLGNEKLKIRFLMLELTEYRLKNGWSRDGKKGSTRFDRIPERILAEVLLEDKADYVKLLPFTLPDEFTAKDLKACAKVSDRSASCGISILLKMGIIERTGKKGRAYIYKRTEITE